MEHIIEPNSSFDFSQLMCVSPTSVSGGNYFMRILQKQGQKPFYIQPPKCTTKQGIIKSGKKMYTDLLFHHDHEQFVEFLESLETFCKTQLFHNREKWFDSSLTEHDIEESFAPTTKLFKSGKFYSVKANIPTRLGKCSLKIFNEDEQDVPPEDVRENISILSIVEIQGIRCTSRIFQLELEVKQLMILKPVDLFESCLFTKSKSSQPSSPPILPPSSIAATTAATAAIAPAATLPSSSTSTSTVSMVKPSEDNKIAFDKVATVPDSHEQDPIILDHEIHPKPTVESTETVDKTYLGDSQNTTIEENEVTIEEPVENSKHLGESILDSGVDEIELEAPVHDEVITLKKRNYVYYKMYKEAKQKARLARDLAIASYMEAKKIRNNFLEEEDVSDEDESVLETELHELKNNLI